MNTRAALSGMCLTVTALSLGPFAGITAAQAPSAKSQSVQSDSRPLRDAALEEQQARNWGLKTEEWARYRELMRGPLGIYSPNLDPLTALGIEARSEQERRHYAELQVRAEARRTEKLLSYQREYDAAWKRLYPQLRRASLAATPSSSRSSSPDTARRAVFIKEDCPPCEARVRALQAGGGAFDVYVVGSRGEDARIRRWAARVGVEPAKVRAGTITLNHDAGHWLSIGVPGALPAVVHAVNGRWERE
jgi:integrating conjugative element protein (TIGR03759 family)